MSKATRKGRQCRAKSNIKSDLLRVGAIDSSRLERYARQTRDNPSLEVYRDVMSKVIFIDDFYIGNKEYAIGEYREAIKLASGVYSTDYEDRAGLTKLDSPISDKKSLVFLAQSAQESNDETTQKKSHGRFQGQGSFSSAARG